MRQVVCIAAEPWTKFPTRTQQLMSRMKDAQVLFFEPPARRGEGRDWKGPGRQLRPGLWVYTLPPVWNKDPKQPLFARYDDARLAKFISQRMEQHGFVEPLLWCTSPAGVKYLDVLPYRGVVYDCYRDWPRYPESWESELTVSADVVFAASPDLAAHLAPCNGNVTLLPFGCNYPMFAKDRLPRPTPLREMTESIFGFVGTLWPDLDLTPLIRLASSRPDCNLVLVGRDAGCYMLPELLDQPNVRYLGPVEPVDVPDYLHSFDVCLQVLRRDRLYDDVIPTRLFEYLSSGRPVVAMLRPDQVENFPDVVYGAHTPQEFSALCSRALEERGTFLRDRRREYGKAAAWSRRAEEVNRILESIGLFT